MSDLHVFTFPSSSVVFSAGEFLLRNAKSKSNKEMKLGINSKREEMTNLACDAVQIGQGKPSFDSVGGGITSYRGSELNTEAPTNKIKRLRRFILAK